MLCKLTGVKNIIVFTIDTYKSFYSNSNSLAAQNGLNSSFGGVNSALGDIPGFGDRAIIPTITINTSVLSSASPPDSP